MQEKLNSPAPGGLREMLAVALPMVLSMSFDTFLVFTNRMFLAKLGPEYMGAALTGGVMEGVIVTFFNGFIGYSTALTAQYLGGGKFSRLGPTLAQSVGLAVCCYPLVLALIPAAHALFGAFPMDPRIHELQIEYFNVLAFGAIFGMLRHAFACFFIGLGETAVVMKASVVGIVSTLFLSYSLVFGNLGFPALGIYGAPTAVVCGHAFALALLTLKAFGKSYRERFGTTRSWRFNRHILKILVLKGLPSGAEMFCNTLAFQFQLLLFNGLGLVSSTAANLVFNWDMVAFVPLLGIEIGATSLVGRYVGAKDLEATQNATRSGIKLGILYSVVVAFCFVGIPHVLLDVFSPRVASPEFLEAESLALTMLRLTAIYVVTETFLVTYAGALRGAGDTFWVMCAMIAINWFLVAALFVAFHILGMDVVRGWAVMVCIFLFFPVVLAFRWRSGKWKGKLGW
jgi:MATE family multidrug resistance protein